MKIETKINKWDLIKLRSFCTAIEIIDKMKRQPLEWEKIFTNKATNRGLISKLYKQPCSSKKKNKANQKIGRRSKQTFLQRRHTDGQKAHERCSISIIIRELQIKTTMRFHLIQVRINAGEGVDKKELSYIVNCNVNWYNHYGEEYGSSF